MNFTTSESKLTESLIFGTSDCSSSQNSSTDFMTSKSEGGGVSIEDVRSSCRFDSSAGLMLNSSGRKNSFNNE